MVIKRIRKKGGRRLVRSLRVGGLAKRKKHSPKIRIGLIVGKNFDPIPQGTQDRAYPDAHKKRHNTGPRAAGWGGMFHIDVAVGVKMKRLHPDVFDIEFLTDYAVHEARLKRNHVNFNWFHDVVLASFKGDKKHTRDVLRTFKSPACRVWPPFDYYDWVCNKPRYMRQCMRAGIPMIDTIFVDDGFKPDEVLKKVKAKGWESFFVKAAAYVCYGNSAIHGKTQEFVDNPSLLRRFVKDNAGTKSFLVQPYTLKPNGDVFDEVRNFFIDGEWAYSVYTDGTDDDAVYEQPRGALKDACRELSERAYQEVLKVAKWCGRPMVPLMCRIDIGVLPDKSQPKGFRVFVNEIECEISTWLARYVPFNLCERLAHATVKKTRELLHGLIQAKRRLPDSAQVRRLLKVLDERLGPLPSAEESGRPAKRRRT